MVNKDYSKDIIENYEKGMHPNEIAARLLLDVNMVMETIQKYEEGSKKEMEKEAGRSFIEAELKKGIISLSEKMEVLFQERHFEDYNKAYENWLDSIRTYIGILENKD